MTHSLRIASALAVVILASSTVFAEDEKQSKVTEWSVSFADDTAVIRASSQTSVGLIQGTIKALQKDGIEKFSLRSYELNAPATNAPTLQVRIHDGEAEISASYELPYKYLASAISILSENGVRKMKFAPAKSHERQKR